MLQRTQIYLSEELRRDIDRERHQTGESLAQYLRKAAEERLATKQKKKIDFKKLAEELGGSIDPKKSGWYGIDIDKWQREIRKDRKII